MKWEYRPHQIEGAEWALGTIRKYGLAYLSWKERTNKTGTAILTVENSKASRCLIVTMKSAIKGWKEHIANLPTTKEYDVINFHGIHTKLPSGKYKLKFKPSDYDFIVIDEAHNYISATGKLSTIGKSMYKLAKEKAILYLSATPYSESCGLLFNQLRMSSWSPFIQYKSFNDWYAVYGIPNMVRTPYGLVDQKNKYKDDEILAMVLHLFNFKTRADVNIEHEPEVRAVSVPLHKDTTKLMETWVEDLVINIDGNELLADSDMRQRTVHYQLEGGTLKVDEDTSIFLPHHEKVDYIRDNYGTDIAIYAHFIKERELLARELPYAMVLSGDGMAEGIDLSHISTLVVYSMSFRTSKHSQRVARQANHNRTTPIVVDILVADEPAIGGAIYNSVAIKNENFVKNSYDRSIR